MGDLTENFSLEEFSCACSCGLKFTVDEALLDILQYMRLAVEEPLVILSGCRCRAHNSTTLGAAENSWHIPRDSLMGLPILYASDVTYADKKLRTPENVTKLYIYASNIKAKGLGLYSNRVHVDSRPKKRIARWISAMPQ